MNETWFEQDLRNWTNIPGYFPATKKAAIILNLAKERLERNDGYAASSTGRIGFRDLENKLNKYAERKKLGFVIEILESFLAIGNIELQIPDQTFIERSREEYELLDTIIKEALISKTVLVRVNEV